MVKKIIFGLIALFVVIQFIRPPKNHAAALPARGIGQVYGVTDSVSAILKKACMDCHSNHTTYPWYFHIQPVAWWMNSHIQDGKRHINFDEFGTYPLAKQYHSLGDIKEQLDKNGMPLASYLWIHTNARLTPAEKQTLITWSQGIRKQLEAKYPPDSLRFKGPFPRRHRD